jgi:hypothetical protein
LQIADFIGWLRGQAEARLVISIAERGDKSALYPALLRRALADFQDSPETSRKAG